MKITLQIPIEEYGTLATLAAMAKMPIDKYVVDETRRELLEDIPELRKPANGSES